MESTPDWNFHPRTAEEFESQKRSCMNLCQFNLKNDRRGLSQYQKHWKTELHKTMHQKNLFIKKKEENQKKNQKKEVFPTFSFTEMKFYQWFNQFGRSVGRIGLRNLKSLLSDSKFELFAFA